MTVTDQISLLYPEGKIVVVKGNSFTIKAFGIGQLPKLFAIIAPITAEIQKDSKDKIEFNFMSLILNHSAAVISLFSLVTKKDADFFEDAPLEEGIELLSVVFEVNEDLFTKKILPLLQKMGGQLVKPATGATS